MREKRRALKGVSFSDESEGAGIMERRSSSSSSSRRQAVTVNSITMKESLPDMLELMIAESRMDWLRSFRDLDPRFQILNFFNELSIEGVVRFFFLNRFSIPE